MKYNHVSIYQRIDSNITFNYKGVVLFYIKKIDGYVMKQINGEDDTGYLDLDVNDNLIIDGVDEI